MANRSATVVGEPVEEGIGRIPGFVNSYTLRDGAAVYLIDTGFSRTAKPIVRAFRDADVPLSQVTRVLLTHHHVDHRGGAAYLLENCPAPISCHSDDVAYVDGRTKAPMSLLMRLFLRARPAPVANILKDHDTVGPLSVIHAPGHTPGEVAFYEPSRKILFSGDSVVEREGRLTLPAARYAANLEQAVASLSRLRALEIELLLPGHGVPVTKGIHDRLDDLIRRAPTRYLHRPSR